YNHNNIWNVLFGTIIYWCAVYCVMQTQVQRYCSMESPQKARRTLYYNLPGLVILAVMAVMCGNVLYAKYRNCDPVTLRLIDRHDQLMPYYVMDTLAKYPGLPGLFVACVFSGSLSTLSSGLNALAAVTWEDLIKDRITLKNEKQALTITKLIAMGYGLLSIAMSFGVGNLGTVLQACMVLVGSMVGPLFAMFLIGIFFRYSTAPATLIGFILGVLASLSLSIGSLVIPRPQVSLPTTLSECPQDVIAFTLDKYQSLPNSSYIHSYDNPDLCVDDKSLAVTEQTVDSSLLATNQMEGQSLTQVMTVLGPNRRFPIGAEKQLATDRKTSQLVSNQVSDHWRRLTVVLRHLGTNQTVLLRLRSYNEVRVCHKSDDRPDAPPI
ncbi:unnamed protein product, partial [Medioppia subpectinata]